MGDTLTIRQEKFAQEYILTGNGTEAYRRAYPKSLKWKEESVNVEASKMMSNPNVSQRITELKGEVKEKFDISAERLLLEQSRLALFDHRRLFDENGQLINPQDMPDDVAAAVSSVKVTRTKRRGEEDIEDVVTEIKLWNKNTALDSLFKNKGLYEKDNSQRVASTTDISTDDLRAVIDGAK